MASPQRRRGAEISAEKTKNKRNEGSRHHSSLAAGRGSGERGGRRMKFAEVSGNRSLTLRNRQQTGISTPRRGAEAQRSAQRKPRTSGTKGAGIIPRSRQAEAAESA